MEFVKGIAGKLVTGAIVLAVGSAALSWYQMPAADRSAIVSEVGRLIGWSALVLALPWALMLVIGRVARVASNSAGIAFVGGLTIIELLLLGWLLHWHVQGNAAWVAILAGAAVAGAYNLLTCDWIAERFE